MIETGTKRGEKKTRLERMEAWFRNQLFFSTLILLGVAIVGTSEVVKGGSELLVSLGIKQEQALQLSTDTAKGELSRKLTELAWRRMFWTQNYLARVQLKRPSSELEYSWNKHLDAVAEWSAEYMVNFNGIDHFYPGGTKSAQFLEIHQKFRTLENNNLVPLRLVDSDGRDHSAEVDAAQKLVEDVNTDLYIFVLNKSDKVN